MFHLLFAIKIHHYLKCKPFLKIIINSTLLDDKYFKLSWIISDPYCSCEMLSIDLPEHGKGK